ncbi:MAG TPA: hypothetical protein VFC00_19985 [Micromonosporaceae bacterium]|nr:hypothetical protein [Micromonosporaceae bacterium]
MGRKRVIIGQAEWGIGDSEADAVAADIGEAMRSGTVAALQLLDGASRPVTVYLNGGAAAVVVVDLDTEPKPSEISG